MFDELSIWEIGFTVTVIPLERKDTSSGPEICLPGPFFPHKERNLLVLPSEIEKSVEDMLTL